MSHSLPSASSGSVESEPASSEVLEPQNLVPSFIGMDYAQVQNNREYTGMYLFYVTEEYSDTVPAGQIMTQEPAADTVLKAGETIRLVVSKGPQKVEMPTSSAYTGRRRRGAAEPRPAGQLLHGGERRLLCRRDAWCRPVNRRAHRWTWAR